MASMTVSKAVRSGFESSGARTVVPGVMAAREVLALEVGVRVSGSQLESP